MVAPHLEPVILVVDDDPADQAFVRRALEESGRNVRLQSASSGAEALDYLRSSGPSTDEQAFPIPHLLLLDLNMPGIDGRDVIRAVRSDPQIAQLVVVVLSTSSDPRDIEECYSLGADSYVVKSNALEELQRTLEVVQEYWFDVVEHPWSR